jgi:uncharacterized protein YggE
VSRRIFRSALAACGRVRHDASVADADTNDPQVVVVGEGISLARPDTCVIGVVLNAMRDTIADALRDVAVLADGAITALREAGFEKIDLPTRNLSVRDWLDPGTHQVTGHVGVYQFAIVVRDLAVVSTVVDVLGTSAGDALQIQGIAFAHSDPAPLLAEARRAAVQDARSRAEELATAAGVRLGRIQLMQEGVEAVVGRTAAKRSALQDVSVPIDPGNQPLSVQVTVAFAIDSED